jgi:hypothetical protein
VRATALRFRAEPTGENGMLGATIAGLRIPSDAGVATAGLAAANEGVAIAAAADVGAAAGAGVATRTAEPTAGVAATARVAWGETISGRLGLVGTEPGGDTTASAVSGTTTEESREGAALSSASRAGAVGAASVVVGPLSVSICAASELMLEYSSMATCSRASFTIVAPCVWAGDAIFSICASFSEADGLTAEPHIGFGTNA